MKLSKPSLAALLSVVCAGAFAQAKAPEPDYTLSFNVGAVSEYRYRGLAQSRFKPAIQGGLDFAHKSGFYAGTWASTIEWVKDTHKILAGTNDGGSVEIDLYGGFKGSLTSDIGFDVGALYYLYPGNDFKKINLKNADTLEIYGALTYGPVTAKYSHSTTTLFGAPGSSGSGYLDLSATFDVGNGFTVVPHIGYQKVASSSTFNNSNLSYTDYAVTLNKDFGDGLVGSLALIAADVKKPGGVPAYASPSGKNLGKARPVLSVKYSF
jgi:uncharacterized protein (TIGR02001 family)